MKANITICGILLLFLGVLCERSDATPEEDSDGWSSTNFRSYGLRETETEICKQNETEQLWRKVRVLCMVMTSEPYHRVRAKHIRNTWGSRCNNLIFISNVSDSSLPSVSLVRGRSGGTHDLKSAFIYALLHYDNDMDWILKAEDESFVVVENLRHFLSSYNSSQKHYIGYRLKGDQGSDYMDGGSGYVLSKGALRALVMEGFREHCNEEDEDFEDIEIGNCLYRLGVEMVDTRDSEGRHRFLPYAPGLFLKPNSLSKNDTIWQYSYYPLRTGTECCSKTWISSRANLPQLMYLYEFLSHNIKLSVCNKKPNSTIEGKPLPTDDQNGADKSLYLELNLTSTNELLIQKGREKVYLPSFLKNATAQVEGKPYDGRGDEMKSLANQAATNLEDAKNKKLPMPEMNLGWIANKNQEMQEVNGGWDANKNPLQQGKNSDRGENQRLFPRMPMQASKERVLCMVMTSDIYHNGRVRYIRDTWGKRCTQLIFMSNKTDNDLQTVKITEDFGEKYNTWFKTVSALKYVYQKYAYDIDWVLKVDDQSYVVVENLISLVKDYNASEKLYFGCRFKDHNVTNGYMTFEAGSVFSRAAVTAFVEDSLQSELCREGDDDAEDILMSRCLQAVGVKLVDTRDTSGKFRFLPLSIEYYLVPNVMSRPTTVWWFESSFYIQKIGFDCCSDSIVALSQIAPINMYLYDFLFYEFKLMNCI